MSNVSELALVRARDCVIDGARMFCRGFLDVEYLRSLIETYDAMQTTPPRPNSTADDFTWFHVVERGHPSAADTLAYPWVRQ